MEGVQSPVSFSQSLWDCARNCALLRQTRKCTERFGSFGCNQCQCKWDIREYGNFDPKQAVLYMIQAERSVDDSLSSIRTNDFIMWFSILVFLFLGFRSYNYYHPEKFQWLKQKFTVTSLRDESTAYTSTQSVKQAVDKSKVVAGRPASETYAAIKSTLHKVAVDYILEKDIDGDGEINCHDSASMFYMYYPWKDEVCIEMNKNPNTTMYHLFNCVLIEGVWRAIEPQAGIYGRSYWMKDYWGKEYDSSYNIDVTADCRLLGWIK